jgi:hypothetical protein
MYYLSMLCLCLDLFAPVFCVFSKIKYTALQPLPKSIFQHKKIPIDHTDFGFQIRFLGSEGLFSAFLTA